MAPLVTNFATPESEISDKQIACYAEPVKIREGDMPREMTPEDLTSVRNHFVHAAQRAHQAGFAGVELHAAHFYLLGAFISPFTNKRTDAYGGDTFCRARLTRKIIQGIKSEVGSDFAVWVRMNGREALEPGLSTEESGQVAAIFEEAGADAVHVSAYTTPIDKSVNKKLYIPATSSTGKDMPPGPFLDYAKCVKARVRIPVVAVGKLDDPKLAESALSEGTCDMVALGKQLLCDPYWVSKIMDQKEGDIVHCKYCKSCHRALHRAEPIVCAQNLNLYGVPAYKISNPE